MCLEQGAGGSEGHIPEARGKGWAARGHRRGPEELQAVGTPPAGPEAGAAPTWVHTLRSHSDSKTRLYQQCESPVNARASATWWINTVTTEH